MKKFRFTLEPVLATRIRAQEEKQRTLAERQREVQAAENELARLHGEFKCYSSAARLEFLERCIAMQYTVVSQCKIAAEHARSDLVQATKERKILDMLRDKHLEKYRVFEAIIEQKELDEVNSRRGKP